MRSNILIMGPVRLFAVWVLLFGLCQPAGAQVEVPLPRERPQETETSREAPPGIDKPQPEEVVVDKPSQPVPAQPKPAFDMEAARQCEQELRRLNADFTVAEPLDGDGQCGWPRPLKLTALSREVRISGDILVRCSLALALARWSKQVVVPSAELHLGAKPSAVEISTSYQCRRRNNGTVGKLSEHAFANGVDVMAIRFDPQTRVAVADRRGSSDAERAFQAAIRGGACAFFTTVLGPVTNANHRDHFHLDLAVRRGGYRLCQ